MVAVMTADAPAHDAAAIAEIAKGLTKAQREAIMNALRGARNGMWAQSAYASVLDDMPQTVCRGRIDPLGYPHVARLTPLGLALRAHISQAKGE
jgi:hypothetical protein